VTITVSTRDANTEPGFYQGARNLGSALGIELTVNLAQFTPVCVGYWLEAGRQSGRGYIVWLCWLLVEYILHRVCGSGLEADLERLKGHEDHIS